MVLLVEAPVNAALSTSELEAVRSANADLHGRCYF
jgi:hypothetical protein